ncbi:MAG TPA: urease accessory protein UreE [Candidatus Accumulibacter phosphatis]|nr:urease accessory protein UreE [Candidatus Accumulibacter phosphatis]
MHFAESFAAADAPAGDRLLLPYEARRKSRQRVRLESGDELGYVLPAGTVLRHGDRLLSDDGRVIEVAAAPEALLEVRSSDRMLLLRAAYHLGNRHVPVQLADGFLRLQPDHVLGAMLHGLGCAVSEVDAPFDPEGGAYGTAHPHGTAHGHGHGHGHGHAGDYRPTRGGRAVDPHDPGHGPHRSPARIHEFK